MLRRREAMEMRAKPETSTPAIQAPRRWLETVIRPEGGLGICEVCLPKPWWIAVVVKATERDFATWGEGVRRKEGE